MRQKKNILLFVFLTQFFGSFSQAANPRETAVDKIAVPLFAISSGLKPEMSVQSFQKQLQKEIVSQLQSKTYLEVQSFSRVVSVIPKAKTVQKTAKGVGVDGVLAGELRPGQLRLSMLSGAGGRSLVRWVLPLPKKLNTRGLSVLAREIVEAVVTAVPYRGYVAETKGDMVRLTLGRQEALQEGQRLSLFEFTGDQPNFSSGQEYVGEIEVTKVRKKDAFGRVVSGDEVPHFAKVSFGLDGMRRLSAQNMVDSKTWATVGFDVFAIDSKFTESNQLDSRDYDLAFSPFLSLAAGNSRWSLDLVYGKAESDLNAVTFSFATIEYLLTSWGDQLRAWTLYAGVTGRQFKSEQKKDGVDSNGDGEIDGNLNNIVGIHPFIDGRWSWIPRDRTKLYFGGRLLWMISETGGEISQSLSSGGISLYGGVRIDLTADFGVEAGVRTQFATVALKNNFSLSESQLTLFWRSIILF